MANYYATARSNYFAINDLDKWEVFCEKFQLKSIMTWDNNEQINLYGFTCENSDGGGIPNCYFDDEGEDVDDNLVEVDFIEELSRHLQKDWVAIVMESGAEKIRYVCGFAFAVNSEGKRRTVSLTDIYAKAEKLGTHVTAAEY